MKLAETRDIKGIPKKLLEELSEEEIRYLRRVGEEDREWELRYIIDSKGYRTKEEDEWVQKRFYDRCPGWYSFVASKRFECTRCGMHFEVYATQEGDGVAGNLKHDAVIVKLNT